ncbi:hypothetical protein O181_003589 [Austropuccinia psidii MF-1]|uniref:Uncharacterized protein n=1 Tax=Austropuccinia psidii MF-1 TaxID=1389203 RepID=A0A9Q3BEA5_9BASI|nr:hypothetical protein [Austropuccinia psidii MF-1]
MLLAPEQLHVSMEPCTRCCVLPLELLEFYLVWTLESDFSHEMLTEDWIIGLYPNQGRLIDPLSVFSNERAQIVTVGELLEATPNCGLTVAGRRRSDLKMSLAIGLDDVFAVVSSGRARRRFLQSRCRLAAEGTGVKHRLSLDFDEIHPGFTHHRPIKSDKKTWNLPSRAPSGEYGVSNHGDAQARTTDLSLIRVLGAHSWRKRLQHKEHRRWRTDKLADCACCTAQVGLDLTRLRKLNAVERSEQQQTNGSASQMRGTGVLLQSSLLSSPRSIPTNLLSPRICPNCPEQPSIMASAPQDVYYNLSELPSLIFLIPFPKPGGHHQTTEKSPSFLLYTFPRALYQKPMTDPVTGKRGKEKLVKKLERKWQEEVKQGEEIKRGEHPNAGAWKKSKGLIARNAAAAIKLMPSNAMEALGRLPPKHKLGQVKILYQDPSDNIPGLNVTHFTENQLKDRFIEMLIEAKRKAWAKMIISGVLLPATLAIDIFVIVPLFLFEINLAYFSLQLNGARKANNLTPSKQKSQSSPPSSQFAHEEASTVAKSLFSFHVAQPRTFNRTVEHLYNLCSKIDNRKFPSVLSIPPLNYAIDTSIVTDLITEFKKRLPSSVLDRHLLDEKRLAEDLDRALKKAAKQYVATLK